MPLRSVMLTPEPVTYQQVADAAQAVWKILAAEHRGMAKFRLITVDDGAALQVYSAEDLLVTVMRPVTVLHLEEIERLLPQLPEHELEAPLHWTSAYTPYSAGGVAGLGVVSKLIDDAPPGVIVHDRLPKLPG
ncbi:MAG TPA: hypothetical protein VK030_05745 [Actinomycetales bacterium]|nr:hypothetical protein [Actinomycetales bacterium]